MLAEQQLRVVYDVSITCAPTGVQTANLTVAGWGTPAGTWALQANMFIEVPTGGTASGNPGLFEPVATPFVQLYSGACTLGSFRAASTTGTQLGVVGGTWGTYTLGTFTRSVKFPYFSAASFASTDIRMFRYDVSTTSLAFRFDSPQTKLDTHRLRPNGYSITIS